MLIKRILIVGYGSIGKRHLRLARELNPDADIRVMRRQVVNLVPEYASGCFTNLEEATLFEPHIAVIATPAPFHIIAARALAEVGAHLLIEKPLSDSLSGVSQLIKICQEKQVVLLIGYNLRFLPSLQRYREALSEGVIGAVLSVRCEIGQYLPSWRPGGDYRQGVSAQHKLGGGALLELSHELDYLRWIFGEIVSVKASLSRQSNLEIDVEDTAHLILGFAPTLEGAQLIATVNLDFIRQDATRVCIAIGEKGSLSWDGLTGEVSLYEAGASKWQELFRSPCHRDESYISEWQNFMECVNHQKLPMITGKDGLEVLKIIEGARLSNETGGRMVELKDLNTQEGD